MTFEHPLLLRVGIALLLLVVVSLLSHARRRRRLAEFFGGRRAGQRLTGMNLYSLRLERVALLGLAALALAAAAAEPRWIDPPADPGPPPPPARTVLLLIDVSASMQAADVAPTRFAQASHVAKELVASLEEARVGIMLFAGRTYLLAPPTHDHRALEYLLEGLTPTIASVTDPGTVPSAALLEAAALLASPDVRQGGEEAIVLIGDGESVEPERAGVESARALAEQGIDLHAIGVGSRRGGAMILPDAPYWPGGPIVDEYGDPLLSHADEARLRRLVEAAGDGVYARASDDGARAELAGRLTAPPEDPEEGAEEETSEVAAVPEPIWRRIDLVLWLSVLSFVLVLGESLLDVRTPRKGFGRFRGRAA